MSTDANGRDHRTPCGEESCGVFDIGRWRAQAGREVDACLPWREKMTAAERTTLETFASKLKLGLPDGLPGSVTQAVYVWANLAGDAESLRIAVENRQKDPPAGDDDDEDDDTTPAGDDDDEDDDTTPAGDDDDDGVVWPSLPDLSGNSLSVDAFRGANFGGFMPMIAAVGIAAFAIWSKPARVLKGKLK